MDNIKKAIADLRDETPCFRVYFQTPNGSYSEWNEKCITFQATATTHRIHVVAVTDFDVCTTCHEGVANNNRHGAYVGISKVQISSDGCTGNCSC